MAFGRRRLMRFVDGRLVISDRCIRGGTSQSGCDILIDFNNDVQLVYFRKGHGIEYPLINEATQMQNILFDIQRQRIVRFGYLGLEDTPYPLVVLKSCI